MSPSDPIFTDRDRALAHYAIDVAPVEVGSAGPPASDEEIALAAEGNPQLALGEERWEQIKVQLSQDNDKYELWSALVQHNLEQGELAEGSPPGFVDTERVNVFSLQSWLTPQTAIAAGIAMVISAVLTLAFVRSTDDASSQGVAIVPGEEQPIKASQGELVLGQGAQALVPWFICEPLGTGLGQVCVSDTLFNQHWFYVASSGNVVALTPPLPANASVKRIFGITASGRWLAMHYQTNDVEAITLLELDSSQNSLVTHTSELVPDGTVADIHFAEDKLVYTVSNGQGLSEQRTVSMPEEQ